MTNWTFSNPVRVRFGAGCIGELPGLIGARRYAVVTYGEPFFGALIDRLATSFRPPAVVIDDVLPNPDFAHLARQANRFHAARAAPEVIVAIGGGSTLDTAKVLAAAGNGFASVRRYLETPSDAQHLTDTPIIAVPTTAGTGSEATCWATVWDAATQKKYSLALPSLYPEWAVVDPELMLGKSRELTVATGLDALSHALESLWNVNANPISATFAVEAAREILDVLPRLADDLGSLALRTRMAKAALMSGMAFSNTRTAIAHSISYPITLRHDVPHGIACSFTLPLVLLSVADDNGGPARSLRRIFGDDLHAGSARLLDMLRRLGVSPDPSDHGVAPEEWESLVDAAFDGERGLNFTGSREKLRKAAASLGIV